MPGKGIQHAPETSPENWLPVVGYEGLYEVSDLGRVRVLDRWARTRGVTRQLRKGRILTPMVSWGYHRVPLTKDGAVRKFRVHRLVLEAFVGPPPFPGALGCHRNGTKTDNRVGNLRWDTPAANMADKRAHGTLLLGEENPRAVLNWTDVERVRDLDRAGCTYQAISDWIGTSRPNIAQIAKGKTWRVGSGG